MNRYIATLAVVSVSSLFILATTTVGSDKEGKNSHISNDGKERISRVQNVHAVEVPKTLSFSGEQVPLHDIDVYERLGDSHYERHIWELFGGGTSTPANSQTCAQNMVAWGHPFRSDAIQSGCPRK